MDSQNGPLFALHLIWHPLYSGGQEIANYLRIHYSRDLYKIVDEEHGVDLLERSDPVGDAPTPLPIDWDNAEFTAIVALTESMMVNDHEWVNYIRDIAQEAQARGHSVGFFPVTMDSRGVELDVDQQALRWDIWKTTEADRNRRLTSGLTHEFCRMLRHHLDELRSPAGEEVSFQRYLEKFKFSSATQSMTTMASCWLVTSETGSTSIVRLRVFLTSTTSRSVNHSTMSYWVRLMLVPSLLCILTPTLRASGAAARSLKRNDVRCR